MCLHKRILKSDSTGAFYGNLGFRFMGVPAQNFQNLAIYIFSKSHDFNFANPPPQKAKIGNQIMISYMEQDRSWFSFAG